MSSALVLPAGAGTNLIVPSLSGGEYTGISWADLTFNPWWGCAKVSPACRFCYAETLSNRFGGGLWGKKKAVRRFFGDTHWNRPLVWNKRAIKLGVPLRVFCASMADAFEEFPGLDEQRARLWTLIEQTPSLRWMLLTKRPENAARMVPEHWMADGWPEHVWCGVSAETQRFADERIPTLLGLPVRGVRFISAEPLLERVDMFGPADQYGHRSKPTHWLTGKPYWGAEHTYPNGMVSQPLEIGPRIDWVIAGGGSGKDTRASRLDWFRLLREQAQITGTAFHFKQTGVTLARELGITGKGDKPHEWPADLRIQDVPDLGTVEVAQ